MREKVGKSRNTVFFQWICGSGESKSRLAKAAGAEPAGQMRDEKMHAVVARSTFRSQNVQNTPFSDHFWKLRCRKSARRCGAKHISKWKCTKHTRCGPLLAVEIKWKKTLNGWNEWNEWKNEMNDLKWNEMKRNENEMKMKRMNKGNETTWKWHEMKWNEWNALNDWNEWNEWTNGRNEWMHACMNERVNGWMNEWMSEWMNEWMSECTKWNETKRNEMKWIKCIK